jgi:hypothetical protein
MAPDALEQRRGPSPPYRANSSAILWGRPGPYGPELGFCRISP